MIDDMLNQTATYWAPGAYDAFGQPALVAPAQLACRWQSKTDLIRTPQGREVVSSAVVYPASAIVTGGWMYLGASVAADPRVLAGAYEVLNVGASPDLDDETLISHRAWL